MEYEFPLRKWFMSPSPGTRRENSQPVWKYTRLGGTALKVALTVWKNFKVTSCIVSLTPLRQFLNELIVYFFGTMNVGVNRGRSCVFTPTSKLKVLLFLIFELAAKKFSKRLAKAFPFIWLSCSVSVMLCSKSLSQNSFHMSLSRHEICPGFVTLLIGQITVQCMHKDVLW